MSEPVPVELTEDRVPIEHIEENLEELVDLYGGEITTRRERDVAFTLPLRRGVASSGSIECTISWTAEGLVKLVCDRNVDAPRIQRILLLVAGVIGSVMFMLWPFFPHETAYGTLAWTGGILAIAVYLMTLRKTSGGIAHDFLQRLAARQRNG
jgi:hypothetical protein